MEKILLPIDLAHPEKAAEVLDEAKKIRDSREASLTVVHVVSPMPGYLTAELPEGFADRELTDCRTELEALVRRNGLDGSTEIVVRRGQPQHEIVAMAKESKADLIVIGSHKPGVADYLLGSVAAAVVRHAPCSVLVKR